MTNHPCQCMSMRSISLVSSSTVNNKLPDRVLCCCCHMPEDLVLGATSKFFVGNWGRNCCILEDVWLIYDMIDWLRIKVHSLTKHQKQSQPQETCEVLWDGLAHATLPQPEKTGDFISDVESQTNGFPQKTMACMAIESMTNEGHKRCQPSRVEGFSFFDLSIDLVTVAFYTLTTCHILWPLHPHFLLLKHAPLSYPEYLHSSQEIPSGSPQAPFSSAQKESSPTSNLLMGRITHHGETFGFLSGETNPNLRIIYTLEQKNMDTQKWQYGTFNSFQMWLFWISIFKFRAVYIHDIYIYACSGILRWRCCYLRLGTSKMLPKKCWHASSKLIALHAFKRRKHDVCHITFTSASISSATGASVKCLSW